MLWCFDQILQKVSEVHVLFLILELFIVKRVQNSVLILNIEVLPPNRLKLILGIYVVILFQLRADSWLVVCVKLVWFSLFAVDLLNLDLVSYEVLRALVNLITCSKFLAAIVFDFVLIKQKLATVLFIKRLEVFPFWLVEWDKLHNLRSSKLLSLVSIIQLVWLVLYLF